jgi:hypothetical protein
MRVGFHHLKATLLTVPAVFFCLGCVIPVNRKILSVEQMQVQIVDLVPMGMPITEARRILGENGFRASSDPKMEGERGVLHLRKEQSTRLGTLTTTWDAAVAYDSDGGVTNVTVRSWETGL